MEPDFASIISPYAEEGQCFAAGVPCFVAGVTKGRTPGAAEGGRVGIRAAGVTGCGTPGAVSSTPGAISGIAVTNVGTCGNSLQRQLATTMLAAYHEPRTGIRRLLCLMPERASASSPKRLAFGPLCLQFAFYPVEVRENAANADYPGGAPSQWRPLQRNNGRREERTPHNSADLREPRNLSGRPLSGET